MLDILWSTFGSVTCLPLVGPDVCQTYPPRTHPPSLQFRGLMTMIIPVRFWPLPLAQLSPSQCLVFIFLGHTRDNKANCPSFEGVKREVRGGLWQVGWIFLVNPLGVFTLKKYLGICHLFPITQALGSRITSGRLRLAVIYLHQVDGGLQ